MNSTSRCVTGTSRFRCLNRLQLRYRPSSTISSAAKSIKPHNSHPASCLRPLIQSTCFSTRYSLKAQPSNIDALMENLNELYATAKDEFEIAAEETEKKTVYAADDREAAQEAFKTLKAAYENTVKESGPDAGRDIQGRVGQRIRELEHALTALEESAMED